MDAFEVGTSIFETHKACCLKYEKQNTAHVWITCHCDRHDKSSCLYKQCIIEVAAHALYENYCSRVQLKVFSLSDDDNGLKYD